MVSAAAAAAAVFVLLVVGSGVCNSNGNMSLYSETLCSLTVTIFQGH